MCSDLWFDMVSIPAVPHRDRDADFCILMKAKTMVYTALYCKAQHVVLCNRGRINEALSGTQCRPAVFDGGLQIVITICNSA